MLTQLAAAAASDEHFTGADAVVWLGAMAFLGFVMWLVFRD